MIDWAQTEEELRTSRTRADAVAMYLSENLRGRGISPDAMSRSPPSGHVYIPPNSNEVKCCNGLSPILQLLLMWSRHRAWSEDSLRKAVRAARRRVGL